MQAQPHRTCGPNAGAPSALTPIVCSLLVLAQLAPTARAADSSREPGREAGTLFESLRRADAEPAVPRPAGKTVIKANQPRVQTVAQGLRLSLGGVRLEGDVGIKPEALDKVLAPWAGRELSFGEYEEAVHALAGYLRSNGHPQAEVRISRAQVRDQQVAIAIQGLNLPATAASPAPATATQALAQALAQAPATQAEPAAAPLPSEPRVFVKRFQVDGVTLATSQELASTLAPFSDRALTLQELDLAANAVASLLQDKGYGLAQAYLPPQRIDGGEVKIAVQQGQVDAAQGLRIAGPGERIKPDLAQRLLASAVPAGQPLQTAQLDSALRVLGETPGVKNVRATLAAGEQAGSTRVAAEVEETSLVSGAVWLDNHGSRYTGQQRQSALLQLNSPTGRGEQASLNLSRSRDMNSYKLAGQTLLGERGLKVGAAWGQMRMNLGAEVAALDLNSSSSMLSLYSSLPLQRSEKRNTTLQANLDVKTLANSFFGAAEQKRRITVAGVSGQGDGIDNWGGQFAWNLTASAGQVSLGASADLQAADQLSAQSRGGFGKLGAAVSRLAPVPGLPGLAFYGSFNAQLASKNLDGGEKFQLGGPTGVRAYPVGEGLGDEGWLASGELRWTQALAPLQSQLQLFAFYDLGGLRQHKTLWAQALQIGSPNTYQLQGMGLGAQLAHPRVGNLKLVVATKVGNNSSPTSAGTDSDGKARGSRIWVIGNIAF
jgi:hemolysin activation/secretion protein